MNLLNLSLGELIGVFSTLSAVLVTLYLLDRSRRRQVVATLKFWKPAENATALKQKRRIQQPWSLILQVISIALLLLALAQLQFGARDQQSRDHILILDTSAWMGARTDRGTLMDDARRAALAWLEVLPNSDRVMVLRADALATPATPLDSNRAVLEDAIRQSRPSSSALNLDQAIEFAQRVQRQHARRAGEIVFVGAGRVEGAEGVTVALPNNFRALAMSAAVENCGLRKVGVRRSPSDPDSWQVFVSAKNYGTLPRVAQLALQFGGAPIGSRTLALAPNTEEESTFTFKTQAAGWLEARLLTSDAFPEDNRAVLEIPAKPKLNVAVFTNEPDLLRPVLNANALVSATYKTPDAYDPNVAADVIILDRFAPPVKPKKPAIWIEPPADRSPIAVRGAGTSAKLTRWNADHDLGRGLRTKDLLLESAEIFTAGPHDIAIAEVERGPVILARPATSDSPMLVVAGFNPVRSAMKYELATPLLFANLLRWMNPELFRTQELNAGAVGAAEARIDKGLDPGTVRVIGDEGHTIPYTIQNDHLRFFAATPGVVRIQAGDRELVYSLTLPEVGDSQWTVPARVRRGLPRITRGDAPVTDFWPWLALLGTIGLFIEWLLFGRGRREARIALRKARTGDRVLHQRAS